MVRGTLGPLTQIRENGIAVNFVWWVSGRGFMWEWIAEGFKMSINRADRVREG